MSGKEQVARSMSLRWVAGLPGRGASRGEGIVVCRVGDVTLDAIFEDYLVVSPSVVLIEFLQGLVVWETRTADMWRVYAGTTYSSSHWQLRFLGSDLCEIGATWSDRVACVDRQTLRDAIFRFAEQILSRTDPRIADADELLDHPDWWPEAEEYIRLLLEYCRKAQR